MKLNKFARSFVIIIPVVIYILSSVCLLVITALKSGIYWLFNWPNYWDLTNEWFQITQEFETWYKYWKTGMS